MNGSYGALGKSGPAGRFGIELPKGVDSIRFHHPGYRTRQIPVQPGDRLRVALRPRPKTTNEVVVKGFASDESLRRTGASVARLDAEDLERYHDGSIRPALNTIPGVRMDSRGIGGSSRISLRGSRLRSPWGVRNIKVYWNGMPLTSPDGSTPIEVLDPKAIGNIEVLKGPSGSLYGAGNGGVIKMESRQASHDERSVQVAGMLGAYGMEREHAAAAIGNDKLRLQLHYGRVRNQGYREQEFVNRDHIRLNSSFYPGDKDRIEVMGYYFDGGWGLPGGLSRQEFENRPREAVPYSVEGNASFEHRTGRLGVKHTHWFKKGLKHSVVVYSRQGAKENPYGTSPYYHGYKIERHQGAGYRNELEWQEEVGELGMELILGSEGRSGTNTLRNFDNEKGSPGDLREHSDTRSRVGLLFMQNRWSLPWDLTATFGVSYDRVAYRHRDHFKRDSVDYSGIHRFSPGWLPRLSFVKGLGEDWAVRASWSKGFSAPTVWELIDPDGSINTRLGAEKGTNYELGVRGGLMDGRIRLDLTGYWFRLRNAILPVEQLSGRSIFGNRGRADQKGVEASMVLQLLESPQGAIRSLRLRQSFAYQSYKFTELPEASSEHEGKRLPGVPYKTWDQILSVRSALGFYLEGTGRFVGKTPLDDPNTAFQKPYYLLGGKLGWKGSFGERFRIDLHGGVHNALNTRYSAFLQVNDYNGNYFNPAPARMWFGGLSLSYDL